MQIVINIDRVLVRRLALGSLIALSAAALIVPTLVWAFDLPASSDEVDLNPPKKPGAKPPKLKPIMQTVETTLGNHAKNFKALGVAVSTLEERMRELERMRAQSDAGRIDALEARVSEVETSLSATTAALSTLEDRLGAVPGLTQEQQEILGYFSIVQLPDGQGNTLTTIRVSDVNVQIVNGLGATNGNPNDPANLDPTQIFSNGLGNLIVGYDEPLPLNGQVFKFATAARSRWIP